MRTNYHSGLKVAAAFTAFTRATLATWLALGAATAGAGEAPPAKAAPWRLGKPIVTYWAGPPITEASAQLMKDGGWNLIWCREEELSVAGKHGLRAMLVDGLLTPASLQDPARKTQLAALVARVSAHPALYNYFITDEPSAADFPGLGALVAYLRELDPAHFAYINLFPTYANNQQLGTRGDTVTAYREHLRLFMATVKPALVSYDHYHFRTGGGDGAEYFLNLGMIRETALAAGVPFLNIVQASSWDPAMRVPNALELRWLAYTSLAYGAQGLSYYVYFTPTGHRGMMLDTNGAPTELYHAAKPINPAFEAIAAQLQPLTSLGAYHLGMLPPGTLPLPGDSLFNLEPPVSPAPYKNSKPVTGWLLGLFGRAGRASHVVVVNLDYGRPQATMVVAKRPLEIFDPQTRAWRKAGGERASLECPPGGGYLVRLRGLGR